MRVACGAPPDQAFGGENRREKEDTVIVGRVHSGRSVLEKLNVVGSSHTDTGARDQGAQEADGH